MLTLVMTSCPPHAAQALADALVERRVAACVTTLPGALSTYRWQGAVQHEEEALLLLKTTDDRVDACIATLRELHPYTVPEIIELPAGRVAEAYLQWALAETRPDK